MNALSQKPEVIKPGTVCLTRKVTGTVVYLARSDTEF